MKTRHLAALSVAVIAPALSSQTVYSPANFASAEANSYGYGGLGTPSTPSVLLSIHEELRGTPRSIRAVSIRRDGGVVTTQSYPAANWLVTVFASTAVTTAAAPSATFAANHGADKQTVAQFALVQLPVSNFGGPASPFEFRIPFTKPFQFGGTGPLCLEIQIQSRSHTNYYYFDYASGANANPYPESVGWGVGCKPTGKSAMLLSPSGTGNWPGSAVTFGYNGSNMPASSLVSVLLGGSRTSFHGLPLPFELPGTAPASSGACSIYNDVLVTIPALTTASGTMTLNLGFGVTPALNGLSLFGQAYALDAAANPWGVVTSNGVQHHLVAPFETKIGTVYADNSLGPTGTVLPNQGYVMKFES